MGIGLWGIFLEVHLSGDSYQDLDQRCHTSERRRNDAMHRKVTVPTVSGVGGRRPQGQSSSRLLQRGLPRWNRQVTGNDSAGGMQR